MKIFQFLLVLVAMVVTVMAQYDDSDDQCKGPCFQQDYEPICAKTPEKADTYYNKCEMKCDNAKEIHAGDCTFEDMENNRGSYRRR